MKQKQIPEAGSKPSRQGGHLVGPEILPQQVEMKLLSRWFSSEAQSLEILNPLFGPLREFLQRSSKSVRSGLVAASFQLLRGDSTPSEAESQLLAVLMNLVESLHAGSLIIDDIQDESLLRRGKPALHTLVGEASAINAGNWLYFWPTEQIRKLDLPPKEELDLYRLYHQTLLSSHYGQALDLSYDMTKVPRQMSFSISMANITLKTGSLTSLCAQFGARVAQATPKQTEIITHFGESFGVGLQMFNDLADLRLTSVENKNRSLHSPSWVWAVAADSMEDFEFRQFQDLVAGHSQADPCLLANHPILDQARSQAQKYMENCMKELKKQGFDSEAVLCVEEIARRVINAYS